MVNFLRDGDSINYTPTVAVVAGDVVVQGTLIGIAKVAIPANTLGALAVKGIFRFAKGVLSTDALTAGATVYWDAGSEVATATASGNTFLGKVETAAAAADSTVDVRLGQTGQ
jgi:predicted RecA/RadA family phage recombinase